MFSFLEFIGNDGSSGKSFFSSLCVFGNSGRVGAVGISGTPSFLLKNPIVFFS